MQHAAMYERLEGNLIGGALFSFFLLSLILKHVCLSTASKSAKERYETATKQTCALFFSRLSCLDSFP